VASAVVVRTKSRLILSLVKQLLVVIEDLANYEKEIQALFLTHTDHEIRSSLKRAGKHLAPRLLAEWGNDRTRYQHPKLAGTAPMPFQMRKTYEIQGKPDEPILALLVALLERCPCVGCAYEPENAYLDRPLCFQSLVY
jgi:hypothetical protein